MTRDEALQRLEGTWSFEIRDGQVMLRDLALIATAAEVGRQQSRREPVLPETGARTWLAAGD